MQAPYPSSNMVVLIGRAVSRLEIGSTAEGAKTASFRMETSFGPETRTHRICVQDEFLAQAIHGSLSSGVFVSVTGELDYDAQGAFIGVTSRRGCDVRPQSGVGAQQRPQAVQEVPQAAQTAPPAPQPQVQPSPQAQQVQAATTPPRPATAPPRQPGRGLSAMANRGSGEQHSAAPEQSRPTPPAQSYQPRPGPQNTRPSQSNVARPFGRTSTDDLIPVGDDGDDLPF